MVWNDSLCIQCSVQTNTTSHLPGIWIAKNVIFMSFYRFNNILNAIGMLTVLELWNISFRCENNHDFINLIYIYLGDIIDASVIMY